MTYYIDLQNASNNNSYIPKLQQLQLWVKRVLTDYYPEAELTIRVVEKEESAVLNQQYRHREGPTNVLSFPFEVQETLEIPLLGDLVICAPLLEEEAIAQGKTIEAHWAHLVIHGTLHLLGYDHQNEADATQMETKEIEYLNQLGYPNPYE